MLEHLPIKVLIFGSDDGVVVPEGYNILMTNLNPIPPTKATNNNQQ